MSLSSLDLDGLKQRFAMATPFRFVEIEGLLEPAFALEVARAYPTFERAMSRGRSFATVNERKKVQITDARLFPEPVERLGEALASPAFLSALSHISGIPGLLADPELVGGGMHVTGPGGRLDVHVDFNVIPERSMYRRLNLLLYLNPVWAPEWGGDIQLWDREVRRCARSFTPALNRCIVFETSAISFHGVTPVSPAAPFARQSFAAYYYTTAAPTDFRGTVHDTIFRARPDERLRRYVLMPVEKAQLRVVSGVRRAKRSALKQVAALVDRVLGQ